MNPLLEQLNDSREFFRSGATRTYESRLRRLKKFRSVLLAYQDQAARALHTDLRKSPEEVWVTETGFLLAELNHIIRNLKKWMRPERKATNLLNFPSSSRVWKEPLGTVLIIGPWNYPLQLLLTPMLGALAAGNTVVLKPSEFAPATAELIASLLAEAFGPREVLLVQGEGARVIPAMMQGFVFDHVFYTGSTQVGRLIYQAAAAQLVPVTLELGGKSPCVVESDANIKVSAKRIMMTKFSNAGQMCVAPDYLLVHESRKEEFLKECRKALLAFFGPDAAASAGYGRIINRQQFDRLLAYLEQGRVIQGGRTSREDLYIEPTLLDEVDQGSAIMREEIFGPILPVLTFSHLDEAVAIIDQNPNPLAFYVFTESAEKEREWLNAVAFGGGCVNNAALHLTNQHLPFGGRGASGTGRYHGKYSFDTFSHEKAVMRSPSWFDPAMKYPPFTGKLGLLKKIIR